MKKMIIFIMVLVLASISHATTISNSNSEFTGNLSVDTNLLYVDSNSNLIGINTNNPSVLFEVNGGAIITELNATTIYLDGTQLISYNDSAVVDQLQTDVANIISYNDSAIVDQLQETDPLDYDSYSDIPSAVPTNGDVTHFSTADQIYDFVTGQGYITDGNTNWDNSYGFITASSLIPKWNIDGIYLINSSGTLTWQMSDEMYTNITTDQDTLGGLSCSANQIAKYNGSDWLCATDETGTGGSGTVTGSGTANTIPYWTNSTNLGDSPMTISGTDVVFSNAIRLGTTIDTTEGNLRYTSGDLQYYNGSAWVSVGGSGGVADTTCEDGICNLSDDIGYKYTSLDFTGTTGLSDGIDNVISKWDLSYPYLENRSGNLAINSTYFNDTYIQESETTNWDKDSTDDYTSSDFNTDFSGKTTDDLTEGSTNLYYNDSTVVNNLQSSVATLEANDPNDYDSYSDIPSAVPTNGDVTHFSTADQIYDFVTGQGYITDGNTNWDNSYGFITASSLIPKWDIDGIYLINSSGTLTWQMSDEMYTNITTDQDTTYTAGAGLTLDSTTFRLSDEAYTNITATNGNTTSEITQAMLDTYPNLDTDSTDDYTSSDFNTDFSGKTTDDLTEGSTNLYYNDSTVVNNLQSSVATLEANDPNDYDSVSDIPTATPSSGDTTHLSTADQIYSFVTSQGYITDGNTNWENQYGYWNNKANWTNAITYSDIVAEFTSCSGTQYLGADGNCHDDLNTQNSEATTESYIFDNDNTGDLETTGDIKAGNLLLNATSGCIENPTTGAKICFS